MCDKINAIKVKQFMESNRLTKARLCKLCGFSMVTLNKMLNGQINLYVQAPFKLARYMRISISELFSDE